MSQEPGAKSQVENTELSAVSSQPSAEQLALPVDIFGKSDLIRLARELADIDDSVTNDRLKGEKESQVTLSRQIREMAEVNDIDLGKADQRKKLQQILEDLQKDAPVMHISFSRAPDAQFMQKITAWFRQQIHPHALLQIGLQPSIAAGCTLRTTNKYFDLSLRKHLQANSKILVEKFRSMQG